MAPLAALRGSCSPAQVLSSSPVASTSRCSIPIPCTANLGLHTHCINIDYLNFASLPMNTTASCTTYAVIFQKDPKRTHVRQLVRFASLCTFLDKHSVIKYCIWHNIGISVSKTSARPVPQACSCLAAAHRCCGCKVPYHELYSIPYTTGECIGCLPG